MCAYGVDLVERLPGLRAHALYVRGRLNRALQVRRPDAQRSDQVRGRRSELRGRLLRARRRARRRRVASRLAAAAAAEQRRRRAARWHVRPDGREAADGGRRSAAARAQVGRALLTGAYQPLRRGLLLLILLAHVLAQSDRELRVQMRVTNVNGIIIYIYNTGKPHSRCRRSRARGLRA